MENKKIEKIEDLMQKMDLGQEDINRIKFLKKEKGLIERTESSKIILAEDNRQVLID